MLFWNDGLFLTDPRLALDVPRRQACGFVSHAHMDHAARHAWTLATHQTLTLLAARGVRSDRQSAKEFGETFDFQDAQLTLLPAGHMPGAAMLHGVPATPGAPSFLYTGDFRLHPSQLVGGGQPQAAEVLVMETTFGRPLYKFPPRQSQADLLAATVRRVLARGDLPVIHAYAVGKSQEIMRMLADRNVPVCVHPEIAKMAHVYQSLGLDPGPSQSWETATEPAAILTLRHSPQLPQRLATQSRKQVKIATTGWAMQPGYARQRGYDYAFPISDHADYDELLLLVEQVQPRTIYCTHGDGEFVSDLCQRGWDARWIQKDRHQNKPSPSSA